MPQTKSQVEHAHTCLLPSYSTDIALVQQLCFCSILNMTLGCLRAAQLLPQADQLLLSSNKQRKGVFYADCNTHLSITIIACLQMLHTFFIACFGFLHLFRLPMTVTLRSANCAQLAAERAGMTFTLNLFQELSFAHLQPAQSRCSLLQRAHDEPTGFLP